MQTLSSMVGLGPLAVPASHMTSLHFFPFFLYFSPINSIKIHLVYLFYNHSFFSFYSFLFPSPLSPIYFICGVCEHLCVPAKKSLKGAHPSQVAKRSVSGQYMCTRSQLGTPTKPPHLPILFLSLPPLLTPPPQEKPVKVDILPISSIRSQLF